MQKEKEKEFKKLYSQELEKQIKETNKSNRKNKKTVKFDEEKLVKEMAKNKDGEKSNNIASEEMKKRIESIKKLQEEIEKERKSYQELCKKNFLQEEIIDEKYQKPFEKIDEKQDAYNHPKKSILPTIHEKERKLEQKINHNNEKYPIKNLQNEKGATNLKEDSQFHSNNNLQRQFEERKSQELARKLQKQAEIQEKMEMWKKYNSSLQSFYGGLKSDSNFYRGALDKQKEDNEILKLREKRMTPEEKKINTLDLQAYKTQDKSLYSMIPGFTPQVGAYSTKNMSKGAISFYDNEFKEKVLRTQLAQRNFRMNNTNKESEMVKFYSPQIKNHSLPPISQQNSNFKHNPITNPLPYNIQNPYILKQLSIYNS